MLPALALPSLASLFEASAVSGVVATGVRNIATRTTGKSNEFSLSSMIDIGTDLVTLAQKESSTALTAELGAFSTSVSRSVADYSAVIPAINSVSKGLVESSTINSGLVNTIATASNKSAEVYKEISNGLSLLNNTLTKMYELKSSELAYNVSIATSLKDSLEAITVSLFQLASLPKVISEAQEHSLGLLYDIHGALNFSALRSQESVDKLTDIHGALNFTAENMYFLANTQSTTNTKIQESLDYAKTKSITASDGTQYSPREIEAKANAEHHLDKKGHNTMDWSLGFVDALSPLDEDLEETSLKNLLELLKTTPLETINSFDDGKSIFKREV